MLVEVAFGHFLVAPVAIADNRICLNNVLSIQLQKEPQNPVGTRVLWTQI